MGYNTWGHKKLDMTERLIHSFFFLFALMLLVREKDFRKKTKTPFQFSCIVTYELLYYDGHVSSTDETRTR